MASLSNVAHQKLKRLREQGWSTNGLALYRNGERGLIDDHGFVGWLKPDDEIQNHRGACFRISNLLIAAGALTHNHEGEEIAAWENIADGIKLLTQRIADLEDLIRRNWHGSYWRGVSGEMAAEVNAAIGGTTHGSN